MAREDIIRMAREAGFDLEMWQLSLGSNVWGTHEELERFAALVAAAKREKVAAWMIERSYATGHGDTIEDLLKELEWQVRESERKAWMQLITDPENQPTQYGTVTLEHMQREVDAEREACAKVAEGWECESDVGDYMTCGNGNFWDAGTSYDQGRADAGAAIRARGKA